jgi:CRP/FNR family transcriptional regulator
MDKEQLLSRTELFRDLPSPILSAVAAKGKAVSFPRNSIIFNDGDDGTSFFAVGTGFVRLVKFSPDGKEIMVRLVKPNEIFAEVILFENTAYPVTAIAGDDTELFSLHKKAFQELMSEESFRTGFFSMLLKRMLYLAERIVYVSAYDVEERFFRFLIERYGKHERYTVTMPKKEIASAMGTVPETFSRLMMRLRQRGIITWEGEILTVAKSYWASVDYDS